MNTESKIETHKIMSMDQKKRKRILNAAMSEFSKGFKLASTDLIARESGVSKGLLFHYFQTKKGLYDFILDYTIETVVNEFSLLLHSEGNDLLEHIWQMSLLKRELCSQYPDIFEFLTASYYQIADDPKSGFAVRYTQLQEEIYSLLYEKVDESLLKDGINKIMAANIIRWTLDGLSKKNTHEKRSFWQMNEDFDIYLEETKAYLDLLRQLLYR